MIIKMEVIDWWLFYAQRQIFMHIQAGNKFSNRYQKKTTQKRGRYGQTRATTFDCHWKRWGGGERGNIYHFRHGNNYKST